MTDPADEDSAENALRDDQPSPWVACPSCGDIWFMFKGVLERGRWVDKSDGTGETYVVDFEVPPFVGSYESGDKAIECSGCKHRFGLQDVGYRTGEEDDSDG